MSALRNAVQRRNHKERAQPHERAKWGLLEKRKDYSLRAKDHNAKKKKIKALQQKASERNEDEFYFGMMSSKTRGGVKIAQRTQDNSGGQHDAGKSLSHDVVTLMKTQDCAYLRTVLQSTMRAAERLEQQVKAMAHGVPLADANKKKTIFIDTPEVVSVELDDYENAADESMDGRLAIEALEDDTDAEFEDLDVKNLDIKDLEVRIPVDKRNSAAMKRQKLLDTRRRQLAALRERQSTLTIALREIEDQRARMNGTAGGINKNGIRFKSRQQQR